MYRYQWGLCLDHLHPDILLQAMEHRVSRATAWLQLRFRLYPPPSGSIGSVAWARCPTSPLLIVKRGWQYTYRLVADLLLNLRVLTPGLGASLVSLLPGSNGRAGPRPPSWYSGLLAPSLPTFRLKAPPLPQSPSPWEQGVGMWGVVRRVGRKRPEDGKLCSALAKCIPSVLLCPLPL